MYGMLVLLYISHIRTKLKESEHLQIAHGYFLIILTFQVQTGLVGVLLVASPTTKNSRILNQLEFSFTSLVFRKKNWLKYSFDSLLYRTSNKRKQLNFAISISGRRYWVPINLCYLQKLEIYCSLILRVHVKFCFN